MKCMSCDAEIPPAWVHAIQNNICPGCGGAIMDDSSKELLSQIREAISKMPNDPEGLAGWILSNFDIRKKGEIEPTAFHRKHAAQPGGSSVGPQGQQLAWANSPTHDFMKRSGADKVLANPKYAAMAQAINSVDGNMYGGQPEPTAFDPEIEQDEAAIRAEMQAAAQKAAASGRRPTIKDMLSENSLLAEGNGAPLNEAETEAVKQMFGGGSDNPDLEGIEDLPPILQQDRLKRLQAQRDLITGNSKTVGRFGISSIRRSE